MCWNPALGSFRSAIEKNKLPKIPGGIFWNSRRFAWKIEFALEIPVYVGNWLINFRCLKEYENFARAASLWETSNFRQAGKFMFKSTIKRRILDNFFTKSPSRNIPNKSFSYQISFLDISKQLHRGQLSLSSRRLDALHNFSLSSSPPLHLSHHKRYIRVLWHWVYFLYFYSVIQYSGFVLRHFLIILH